MDETGSEVDYIIVSRDGVSTLAIRGRLDARGASMVREKIAALPAAGHLKLVLDLSGLSWIDSTGVGLLVMLFQRTRALGGAVCAACLQQQPRQIFRLLRLETAIKIFEDVDEAAAALA